MKDFIKWWPIGVALVGGLVLWGSLPERVRKVEAGQAAQQEDIVDLKGVAGKLDGYIAAQQQMNRQMLDQRQPPVYETDQQGVTWVCDTEPEDCWERQTWRRVE